MVCWGARRRIQMKLYWLLSSVKLGGGHYTLLQKIHEVFFIVSVEGSA